jgi:hypothetical protein
MSRYRRPTAGYATYMEPVAANRLWLVAKLPSFYSRTATQ